MIKTMLKLLVKLTANFLIRCLVKKNTCLVLSGRI